MDAGPNAWACEAGGSRPEMGSRGDAGGRGLGRGQALRPGRGPRRPQRGCGTAEQRSGLSDAGRGSASCLGHRAGQGRPLAPRLRSLPDSPARLPHLQDPDPARAATCGRFGRLRGLQRARGPRLHLPHRRQKLHRDARPARQRAEPRRRARTARGPAPRGPPAPPSAPPLPRPRGTCVAAGTMRPRRREPHAGGPAARSPRAESDATAGLGLRCLQPSVRRTEAQGALFTPNPASEVWAGQGVGVNGDRTLPSAEAGSRNLTL